MKLSWILIQWHILQRNSNKSIDSRFECKWDALHIVERNSELGRTIYCSRINEMLHILPMPIWIELKFQIEWNGQMMIAWWAVTRYTRRSVTIVWFQSKGGKLFARLNFVVDGRRNVEKWANVWFTVSQQRTSTAVTANHRPQAFLARTTAPLAAAEITTKINFKCHIILYHSIGLEMLFQKSFGSNSVRRSVRQKMARKRRRRPKSKIRFSSDFERPPFKSHIT